MLAARGPRHRQRSGADDRAERGRRREGDRRRREAATRAREILKPELADARTIASLARSAGTSACYLKRAFRELTGQAIAQFLRPVRMEHALALLEYGNVSVMARSSSSATPLASKVAAAFSKVQGIAPSCLRGRC